VLRCEVPRSIKLAMSRVLMQACISGSENFIKLPCDDNPAVQ
jgi:hypothetical protein